MDSVTYTRTADEIAQSRERWRHADAQYGENELRILGKAVMQGWEDPYMLELAKVAVSRGGRVLEVGFGMGISARYIAELAKTHGVVEHVIIEANEQVFEKLKEHAAKYSDDNFKVTPVFGFWEEVTSTFVSESFDGILFDPYPIDIAEEADKSYSFVFEGYRLLKNGGRLTYYSNEIEGYSELHLNRIQEAGFTHIDYKLCEVNAPEGCEYWNARSILVPILTKNV